MSLELTAHGPQPITPLQYEKFDEPIEVIVHFSAGQVKPLRFLWRGTAHKIEAVRGRWTSMEGQRRRYHWAVHAAQIGACEIALDVEKMTWSLKEVAVE